MPFRFNPFTDRLDLTETGGGGGGVTQLTPDSGSAVTATAGNINVFGYLAGASQVLETYNNGGNFEIANNSFITPYVVDPSSTAGSKGTYQTIQAALNQAATDGMAYTNQKVIYIRPGSYSENLTIPGGAILAGQTLSVPVGGITIPFHNTVISGNHTFSGIAVCGFNNLIFEQLTSGDVFNGGSAGVVLGYVNNCTIINTGSGQMLNAMPASSSFNFIDCTFVGGLEANQFTGTNMQSLIFEECTFSTICDIDFDNCANCYLRNCTGITNSVGVGMVTMGSGSFLYAQDCWFTVGNGNNYCILGTGTGGELQNCTFSGALLAGIHNNNGTWVLHSCSCGSSVTNGIPMFTTPANVNIVQQIQGNIISSTLTATDLALGLDSYYIGVTSTAAARTIFLPDGTGAMGILPCPGQAFIVKDQSGGAGTNNITVTTQGGTLTIDGATSVLINTNYGSLTFKFDGSNYFIL